MGKREAIVQLLLGLNEVFPEFSFSNTSMTLYVESLEAVDFEKLKSAAKKCVSICRCFPKPIELIDLANNL